MYIEAIWYRFWKFWCTGSLTEVYKTEIYINCFIHLAKYFESDNRRSKNSLRFDFLDKNCLHRRKTIWASYFKKFLKNNQLILFLHIPIA